MFATVAVVGIQTLTQVDFDNQNNMIIVGTSVGLGMMATAQPHIADNFPHWAQIVFGSGITLGSVSAMALHLVFNHFMPETEKKSPKQPSLVSDISGHDNLTSFSMKEE